ncbi:Crotonobetainyl-CoA:carnitine CoA-transferase CaiB-like acyl-CoA transferase [Paracidovorax anthurii]|uniref:Crotonobetainyl-CoA:carnitine CoA-transferase CaiB-like acyl-CoA transferase n=2 Tax=Paracidovorax anthurii TaxID=78229 RepID=A0A328YZ03_9BURK|nr:crotonobetainyl-CoA:carnitine CoA-transferase CaiB-like acyl-CoA transferase [Paracidovorax anthurii]
MLTELLRPPVQAGLLSGCDLEAIATDAGAQFAPMLRSLHYQAARLGFAPGGAVHGPHSEGATFRLNAPEGTGVTVAVAGWPDGGTARASEFLVQAASGLMGIHGRSSGGSRALGVDFVSTATAALALQGAMAGLLARLRGADVSRVELSMGGTALLCAAQYIAGATAPEDPESIAPGSHTILERPPFVSSDGVVFELECLDAPPWRAFWQALGVGSADIAKGWQGFLLRYAKAVSPVPASLMQALRHLPYAEIAVRSEHAGIAICRVRALHERRIDPDTPGLLERGPWRFSTGAIRSPAQPRPHPGGLPLAGLTVIESCRRIQGPLAGHLLASMGANVVRIEPPGGDPLRGMPPMSGGVSARFDALNRAKAVHEIDIKSPAGRQAVLELVRDADVFLHNWAPGKAGSMGLDAADMARVNPALVYAHAGDWGGTPHAPRLPGTDFTAQAHSGVAALIGQASGTRGGTLFTALDVLGGIVAAQGIIAALLRRHLDACVSRVDTSLLDAATLLSAPLLENAAPHAPPAPQALPWQTVLPTGSGPVAIECHDRPAAEALARALGLPAGSTPRAMHAPLAAWLSQRTACDAQQSLTSWGVPAQAIAEDLADLGLRPGLAQALHRPNGSYLHVTPPWRWS